LPPATATPPPPAEERDPGASTSTRQTVLPRTASIARSEVPASSV
jgi:hypothetical protein